MDQRWLVWVNGSPVMPEHPLTLDEVPDHFRDQVELSEPDDRVEVRVYNPEQ